jgi:hypothetical protein
MTIRPTPAWPPRTEEELQKAADPVTPSRRDSTAALLNELASQETTSVCKNQRPQEVSVVVGDDLFQVAKVGKADHPSCDRQLRIGSLHHSR